MDRETALAAHRRRLTFVVALALAILAASGVTAQQAAALETYMHGGIDTCGVCHQDEHSNWPPTNEKCLTCHTTTTWPIPH